MILSPTPRRFGGFGVRRFIGAFVVYLVSLPQGQRRSQTKKTIQSAEESAHSKRKPDRLFWLWLAGRTLLWALLATLTQHTPPLDTIEWLCWGREWQPGYHKHPPLAAWVAECASALTPDSFAGLYLTSYAAIAVALWCVWRLARRFLPARAALAATLCLDGLVFFHYAAAEFNNQVLLIAFWALAIYLFHRALEQDRFGDWIGTGLALGLALLCKYSAGFLILPLLGLWLWRNGFRRWSRPALVALVAALIFLPHFVWLCQHDFPTLRWAALRSQGEATAIERRLSAVTFLLSQGVRLLPVVLILLPLIRVSSSLGASDLGAVPCLAKHETRSDRAFLVVAVVGPLALHLAAAVLLGVGLRDIWGAPLWTFAGLLLLSFVEVDTSARAWRRMGWTWAMVSGLSVLLVVVGNLAGGWCGKPLRIHYPGPELARVVTQRWQERFATPLPIAAGDWWLAGNVCCHSPSRPSLYASLEPAAFGKNPFARKGDPLRFANPDPRTSPWTSDADLCRRGGVLLWDADCYGADLPEWLRRRFPAAQGQPALVLPCAGCGPKVQVGWAMISPAIQQPPAVGR
jgi:hypothetical protein